MVYSNRDRARSHTRSRIVRLYKDEYLVHYKRLLKEVEGTNKLAKAQTLATTIVAKNHKEEYETFFEEELKLLSS